MNLPEDDCEERRVPSSEKIWYVFRIRMFSSCPSANHVDKVNEMSKRQFSRRGEAPGCESLSLGEKSAGKSRIGREQRKDDHWQSRTRPGTIVAVCVDALGVEAVVIANW